jgi:hypothetical protein
MKAKDVKYIFQENPELSEIGTKTQYYKYLKTIFPESKVKDIVYHGTNSKEIEDFKMSPGSYGKGAYFQTKKDKYFTGTFGENVIPAILDTKNPFTFYSNFKGDDGDLSELWKDLREYHREKDTLHNLADDFNSKIQQLGHDSSKIQITDNSITEKDEFYYLVFNPKQIHVLGSKKDQEGFKKFAQNNSSDSLEKRLTNSIFAFFALAGLIFSTNSLTGNVIATTTSNFNFSWPALSITALAGLFLTKKYKK